VRPAAVLFDCDGVLVDSEGPTFVLLQEDLAAHGLRVPMAELERDWRGYTVEILAHRARTLGARLPEGWVPEFYERMFARLADAPLIPGAAEAVAALQAAGIPMAVGSNGPMRKMRLTLGGAGLLDRFGAVLSAQDMGAPKPAPDVWLAAARALGVDPAACVVVEDSAAGALAARAAGIPCLGLQPHGPDPDLIAAGARPLAHMADLPALLGV
jgi:HAD superfamily hydrolase (TIGR01509 family)